MRSPETRSGARLVARTVSRGQAASSAATRGAAASTCSRLSRTSSSVAVSQQGDQLVGERTIAGLPHAQGLRDRRQDEGGIADRGERHEGDAVGEGIGNLFGYSHRQPGLADPAGPNQGNEWRIRAQQQRVEGGDLTLPPNQRGQEPRAAGPTSLDPGRHGPSESADRGDGRPASHEAWIPPAAACSTSVAAMVGTRGLVVKPVIALTGVA